MDGSKKIVKNYYFQIDNSSFRLSESEFVDLFDNSLKPMAESFRQFNTIKSIVLPISN